MIRGGNLSATATFKKIISLGYEFETSELSKLSLHQNKKTLVNSDIAPRVLPEREERESIKRIDNNYISVRIPIGVDLAAVEAEFADDTKPEELDEEELEDYERNKLLEKWAKKENERYLDYFYEYRRDDNQKSVQFEVTNDLGETAFGSMLGSFCENVDKDKNDLYFFRTKKGKTMDIKFTEEIAKTAVCDTFSGVEYVITYYNPKKDNANVIVDTFLDAVSRIIDHYGNLKPIEGTLLINDGKSELTTVGYLEGTRILYHKPNTNLYYMQTYDSFDTLKDDGSIKLETILDVAFAPQMTFKCKASDAIEIMIEILRPSPDYKVGKTSIHDQKENFKGIELINSITEELFKKYNEVSGNNINISTGYGKTMKTYAFLIIYKMFMFFEGHNNIMSGKDYLKDHLTFNSRHGNYDLYERIKEIFEEEFQLDGVTEVQVLFENTEVMAPFFINELKDGPNNNNYKDDYDANKKYKYGDDFVTKELPENDENYGNPLYSVKSYFKYLETNEEDWLKDAEYDKFSTKFSLIGDEVLIENRWFRYSISLYFRNTVDATIHPDFLKVKDMLKIINKVYPIEKIKKMNTLEWNPNKKKMSRKCKPGEYRNIDFVCVLTKRNTSYRSTRKNSTAPFIKFSRANRELVKAELQAKLKPGETLALGETAKELSKRWFKEMTVEQQAVYNSPTPISTTPYQQTESPKYSTRSTIRRRK
jgi:hypothetical protein